MLLFSLLLLYFHVIGHCSYTTDQINNISFYLSSSFYYLFPPFFFYDNDRQARAIYYLSISLLYYLFVASSSLFSLSFITSYYCFSSARLTQQDNTTCNRVVLSFYVRHDTINNIQRNSNKIIHTHEARFQLQILFNSNRRGSWF